MGTIDKLGAKIRVVRSELLHAVLSRSVVSDSLWPRGLQPTRLLCPWDSAGKNTGVGCHVLLQGIFPTQGWNPRLLHLLHWQVGSLSLLASGKSSYSNSGLFNWVYFYLFTTLNTLWQGVWRLHFTRGINLTLRNSLHLQNILWVFFLLTSVLFVPAAS